MKKNTRDINYLKSIIDSFPEDYENIRNEILIIGRQGSNQLQIDDCKRRIETIVSNLKSAEWQRKHVYYLIHDLLTNYRNLYPDFDTFLLEIDSSLIGYCSVQYIDKYINEPEDDNDRAHYVRSYEWLK